MEIYVAKPALKHGLSEKQIRFAFEHPLEGLEGRSRARDFGKTPPRYGLVGVEPYNAQSVELVYSYLDNGVVIFHANWLTKGFLKEMKEANKNDR